MYKGTIWQTLEGPGIYIYIYYTHICNIQTLAHLKALYARKQPLAEAYALYLNESVSKQGFNAVDVSYPIIIQNNSGLIVV